MLKKIKDAFRQFRKLLHYENPVEQQMFINMAKRVNSLAFDIDQIRQAIADPDGWGMFQLRLRNLHVPRQYEYMFYELQPGDVCIDCGANRGLFTDLIISRGGIAHSFEPNPVLFRELERKYNGVSNVFLYEQAVSNRSGAATFHLPANMNENYLSNTEAGAVDVWDSNLDEYRGQSESAYNITLVSLTEFLIDKVLSQNGIYLLKLDVEGAEFDILPDLIEKELYRNIRYIVCETHERFMSTGVQKLNDIKEMIQDKKISNIYLDWI